jgi:hypothetical protein
MPSLFDEEKRREVGRLLQDCMNEKVTRGSTAEALGHARKAYDLTRSSSPVVTPWPQVAAYRLAHLTLRSADNDANMLQAADRLFAEAATANVLGATPYIYRLATLSRRRSLLPEGHERSGVQQAMDEVFQKAVQQLRIAGHEAAKPEGVRRELNTSAFNLLELSCYMLGLPY